MKNMMMAANLYAPGDLRYEKVRVPVCKQDEVLLAVHYCGICGSDVPRVLTKGTYHFPMIPGHELSGVVAYDPDNQITGMRATVYPLIPCRKCNMCQNGKFELCEHYDYYGSRCDGGFAEYIAVKRENLVHIPATVSLRAAALCEPIAVSYHATKRLGIKPGDRVLISGAGPIALLAAQWLRSMGAEKVYLFDIVPEKVEYAKKLGFYEYDGFQVDAALEGTGFSNALQICLNAVNPCSRIVLMGNPAREVNLSQQTYWQILRKELIITGTWNSSFDGTENDWITSIEALRTGTVQTETVVSHEFQLSEIHKAFDLLTDSTKFKNRVLIKIRENDLNE